MKKLLSICLALVACACMSSVQARSYKLEGAIGNYGITMVLNSNLDGYYYYDHRPKSRFKLKATKTPCRGDECMQVHLHWSKHVVWQEYTPDGKNSGVFEGVFYERGVDWAPGMSYDMEPTKGFFEGIFRNKSNGKIYDVYMEEPEHYIP